MIKTEGFTLMHEHLTIDLSKQKNDEDCRLDNIDETLRECKELYAMGVRNILDVTNIGMGRNIAYIKEIEKQSGIKIYASTGFYKEPFLPDFVYTSTVQELADMLLHDIEEGIDNSDKKAICIGEIGTSKHNMSTMEQKVFDASILAAKQCGCMIYTHTTLGTYGYEQAQYLIQHGIEPDQIVIGHMDLSNDLETIKKVIQTGVNIGFDTVGKSAYLCDEKRVEFLLALEKDNVINKVVLSMDLTRKSHLKDQGGIGYTYLFDVFVPMMQAAGIKASSIEKMLIDNPQRLLKKGGRL